MNKADLVRKVCENTGFTKADVEKLINQTLEVIKEAAKKDEKITLMGFGSFDVVNRKERNARDFKSGKVIKVPAKKMPKFRPSQEFVDRLNG